MRRHRTQGGLLFVIFTVTSVAGIAFTWVLGTFVLGIGPRPDGTAIIDLSPPRLQVALATGAVFALLFATALARRLLDLWTVRRDTGAVAFRPPAGLRPAQIGFLLDGEVDEEDLVGSVLDLAARGHVRIVRADNDITCLLRTEGADDLLLFEQVLLERIFSTAGTQWVDVDGTRTSAIELGQLRGRFAEAFADVRAAVLDDVLARRWVRSHPDDVRWNAFAVGSTGLVVSAVAAVVLINISDWVVLVAPCAIASAMLLLIHPWLPTLTGEGRRVAEESAGFRRFVQVAEAGRASYAERSGDVIPYLGHAVALGLVHRWVERFGPLSRAQGRRSTDPTPLDAYREIAAT